MKSEDNIGQLFVGLLTILFIGLKLGDNIDWSWWWVLSPLWLPLAIVVFVVLLVHFFTALFALMRGGK